MEAHDQQDNHDQAPMAAAPRPATPADCPVCYGELGNPDPICPNGHKVCDTCRPHIMAGLPSVYGGRLPPRCPICRQNLGPREPAPQAAPRPRVDHRNVGGFDAIGRAGGGRPHNGPIWDAARQRFLDHRDAGRIPPNSIFGGIHERKCGHRGCQRSGGSQGVRFLLYGDTGKRRYRCEEHTDG